MTNPEPGPPAEQPRYFTIFDAIYHLLLVAATCGGFYLGLLLSDRLGRATEKPVPFGGCCCGFGLAVVAHFAVLALFAELSRRANRDDPLPPGDPPNLE